MPKINTSKSVEINAAASTVREVIANFNEWRPWSPWLILEPEATTDIASDGKSYSWEGKRVGSGQMAIEHESNERIDCDLLFLKPWKSKAKTSFDLKENGGKTTVTWNMDSSLPFFMFFMKKQMEAFIGMDYERGLSMLKEYIEEGKVSSKLEFPAPEQFEGGKFIGIKETTSKEGMASTMESHFASLFEAAGDRMTGTYFSQYHKFDMVKNKVEYTAAVSVSDYPENIDSKMIKGSLPAMKVKKVRHTGPYDYLGNPWSAAQMMIRGKEFKPKKGIHPFELYVNNPQEVSKEELITEVCFAV